MVSTRLGKSGRHSLVSERYLASLLHFTSHRLCKCPRLLHPVMIIAGNSCPHKENVGYRDG
ncbi:hypothetical protein TIFTF001_041253 [Ficus carica]|uniref:Uncharacterized protein n=1 Tax=Ficus carica TaxID=3494 RepID=A0AA88D702_FICCA|nr:hypothetical protein TIFTF001_041253 [Ficus carica]